MPSNEEFFASRRAAAAFKHGLLSRYPVVFAGKAGSITSGRVVFLDGYAGAGRYEDGSPGSPLLFVRAARALAKLRRTVTAIFVEQHPGRCAQLREALAEVDGAEVDYYTIEGDLGVHLPGLLPVADGSALFAFLDPFGTALDRQQLRSDLLGRAGRAPTEVLLHFSISTVARIGGLLRVAGWEQRELDEPDRKTVANVDRFLGGQWWHESFRAVANGEDLVTATKVALEVAQQYCADLCAETGFRSISMPVRPGPMQAPKYVLVLFTRHPDGIWEFASALGRAGRDWQRALYEADRTREAAKATRQGQYALFDSEPFDPDKYERDRRGEWVRCIAANIERLLDLHGNFKLIDHTVEVYGSVLGQAWDKHLRRAVKDLHEAAVVGNDGKYDFWLHPLVPLTVPRQRPEQKPHRGSASGPRSGPPAPGRRPSGSDHPTA